MKTYMTAQCCSGSCSCSWQKPSPATVTCWSCHSLFWSQSRVCSMFFLCIYFSNFQPAHMKLKVKTHPQFQLWVDRLPVTQWPLWTLIDPCGQSLILMDTHWPLWTIIDPYGHSLTLVNTHFLKLNKTIWPLIEPFWILHETS